MSLIYWWLLAAASLLALYIFAVRGWVINWVGLFKALPGILFDSICGLWFGIFGAGKRIELDEYERFWND